MKITKIEALEKIANRIRMDIITEVYYAKSGHPGGSLSIADIMAVLYFNEMNISEDDPNNESRDRLVLSKGHASAALYATLAEKGYFSKEDLLTFRNINSNLQGHPDMTKVKGVDMTRVHLDKVCLLQMAWRWLQKWILWDTECIAF